MLNSSHPRYASFFNIFGSRNDSTTAPPPPAFESVAPTPEVQPTNPPPIADPSNEFRPSTTDAFDPYLEETWEVDEHIGYLKELGLDYGWGPTSMVQWIIEYVYIYSGLPWGVSIVCIVAAFRLLMFPGYVKSNDMAARFSATKPLIEPMMAEMNAAKASGDFNAQMLAQQKVMAKRRELGLKFLPMGFPLIQLPIGFGTFRLLRGMGTLPVPGFDTAGFWWFPDLTLPDPLFLLPIATSAIYYYSFKVMSQTREVTASPATTLLLRYVLPGITLCFSVFFPSSLQISLFTTAFFTAGQSILFRQTWFRQTLNMHPLKLPGVGDPKVIQGPKIRTAQSIQSAPSDNRPRWGIARVKSTLNQSWEDLKKQAGTAQEQKRSSQGGIRKRTEAEMQKAKQYEEKRRKELARR